MYKIGGTGNNPKYFLFEFMLFSTAMAGAPYSTPSPAETQRHMNTWTPTASIFYFR
jgi:hypothetical protein